MTTLARIALALLITIFFSSCAFDINFGNGKNGNGNVVTDSREITNEFTIVSASEGLDVYVTQADDFNIKVEADDNVIDLISTDIKDGKLRIHTIENIGRATKKIYVSLPEITALNSSSGSDLIAQNLITGDKIELNASSGSDLNVKIKAYEIDADASSGADIKVSGETNILHTNASSGADIKAKNLLAKICYADASSGSDITVNVSESLTADASSGADISYSGNASVESRKRVSGSIHHRE